MTKEQIEKQHIRAIRLQQRDGTECVRIIRIRTDGLDPDFLMPDGTWWNAGPGMKGQAYALPDNREYPLDCIDNVWKATEKLGG